MNLYKLHSKPEQLDGYEDKLYIPQFADEEIKYLVRRNTTDEEASYIKPYIVKRPELSSLYIAFILNHKPWPEAEPYIMKNPEYAIWYATLVLKRRWVEAEKYIKQDAAAWKKYKRRLKIK